MSVKRWMSLAAALVMTALLCTAALADVSGINIIGAAAVSDAPAVYLEMRALDGTGAGMRTQQQDFRFTAGEENIELTTGTVPGGNRGHIVVVDTSMYYYGSKNVKAENIREIVGAYLSRLSSDERVMFVLSTDAARPTCTNYMTLDHAREYAQGIELGQAKSARINTAIYEAFGYAIAPAQGAPLFNSVFIVADPDLQSNDDREHTLNESVQMRASSGRNFDVGVAVLHRDNFLQDTSNERRKALEEGFAKYAEFAKQCGGRYVQIPQDNKGVDTNEVHVQLSSWLYTTQTFCVDFSALSGHIPTEPQVQNVKLSISCNGAVREMNVLLDTALLPEPEATPVPTPDVPTPTPAPTPVVARGQDDAVAMQAIHALQKMNYLNKSSVKEFDNDCFIAYIDFCEKNGVDPRDGIYEETYHLMLSGEAVAIELATPAPTPTPEPTIPPEGYAINDQDTEHSGGYIARIQAILKNLNCYGEEATSNVGRMDQATVDAANKYCEAFNWRNDHPNGVSKAICTEIITNGEKLNPIATPQPTMQEKAKAFLAGSTQILEYVVPNWMLVAACFALVILIALILILCRSGKKGRKEQDVPPQTKAPQPQGVQQSFVSGAQTSDEEETVGSDGRRLVMLEIGYAGMSRQEACTLTEGRPFTIGRRDSRGELPTPNLVLDGSDKSASRGQHAMLLYKSGQVYLSDLSKYHNTMLNGMSVFEREGRDGVPVKNGDEITISSHTIRITW